jgi:hypothetical protein
MNYGDVDMSMSGDTRGGDGELVMKHDPPPGPPCLLFNFRYKLCVNTALRRLLIATVIES